MLKRGNIFERGDYMERNGGMCLEWDRVVRGVGFIEEGDVREL